MIKMSITWKENNKLDPIAYDFKAAANKPNVR